MEHPYYPIIYVRGFAGTENEVEETVATPYMGFNLGSTKIRQWADKRTGRFIFESPLVRLMKDHGYRDIYYGGDSIPPGEKIPQRSVVIYRYYDQVSSELGTGDRPEIEVYARGLGELIEQVRDQVCRNEGTDPVAFKVHLVAHSMGGLICRCLLQNPPAGTPNVTGMVDKVFTYATPHNGIDFRVLGNVPGFFSRNNLNTFNRTKMAGYLGLPPDSDRVDSLNGKFPPERFFSLVGTNHKDYEAAHGWSRRLVGPMSDGLVSITNATVRTSPRAFVYRSHSGHYGIVNSEDGFQNLVRFLFGDIRVDGRLKVNAISLPPEVEKKKRDEHQIRASYHFECVVRTRGANFDLSRRLVDENSAVLRSYDEMIHPDRAEGTNHARHPHLFTVFLSKENKTKQRAPGLVFSVEIRVLVPQYEIDGRLFKHHIEGSYIYRETLHISAEPPGTDETEWTLRYGLDSRTPGRPGRTEAERSRDERGLVFTIPIRSTTDPGIEADLELAASLWNQE